MRALKTSRGHEHLDTSRAKRIPTRSDIRISQMDCSFAKEKKKRDAALQDVPCYFSFKECEL